MAGPPDGQAERPAARLTAKEVADLPQVRGAASATALEIARKLKGMPSQRVRAVCSTFSALNVEACGRAAPQSLLSDLRSLEPPAKGGFARQTTAPAAPTPTTPPKLPFRKGGRLVRQTTAPPAPGSPKVCLSDTVTSDTTFAEGFSSDSPHEEELAAMAGRPRGGGFAESRKYLMGFRHCAGAGAGAQGCLRAERVEAWVQPPPAASAPPLTLARQISGRSEPQATPRQVPLSRQTSLPSATDQAPSRQVSMSRQVSFDLNPGGADCAAGVSRQVSMSRQVSFDVGAGAGEQTPAFSRQVSFDLNGGGPMSRQATPKPEPRSALSRQVTPRVPTNTWRRSISEQSAVSAASSFFGSPKVARSPLDELKRTVQGLLNKVCPENVGTIAQKIGAVEICDPQQLEAVIELVFKKALAEPHYCETYADLVFALRSAFPEFPSPEGPKPITFRSSVLNICQNEFEELVERLEPSEKERARLQGGDLEACRKRRKDRLLANMKFIGHLYLRELLSVKVIGAVLCELVLSAETPKGPEEHALECSCELLNAIGFTLEHVPAGQVVIEQVCGRLLELKGKKLADGRSAYCKRVQFVIQDVLDTRAAGWSKVQFRSSAKTKEEIRQEQSRDLTAKGSGAELLPGAEVVVAGQRPNYLSTRALGA